MAKGSGGLKRGLSRAILTAAGTTLTATDQDGDEPHFPSQAIYYANHSSNLDFVAILAVVPKELQPHVRPIAAADYWGKGLRGAVARGIFNAHLVQRYKDRPYTRADMRVTLRTDSGSSPKAAQLAGMTEVLDEGNSLIIFPEGTRGPSDHVARFHAGLYRLARHAPQLPVVPVTLKHLGRVLPKGAIFPRAHPSQVVVHDPIYLGDNEAQDDFLARAREIIAAELQREG
ncbi:lysophospholipid acyltransferase family protein [Enteractinococcus fodinae]|uniref:1-acyl-sn-glycerol-3-phosphate acyltransferase n=1 Tax=Enteractinococcus fodinae TaxID=684663 RepID=A0ABU2AX95_9MICC|nr:lysophospholipid acyltransferase family protein [Enteractinococcus fodinae]MDR7345977.1 1-acyl-sn-glycerol-3-phosphate acyltransferase [Enteractinococcus fodinae]